jgi:hypothetical protein
VDREHLFQMLAQGQRPEGAVKVRAPIPESTAGRLTQTKPGDRLVCRVIGAVVPP